MTEYTFDEFCLDFDKFENDMKNLFDDYHSAFECVSAEELYAHDLNVGNPIDKNYYNNLDNDDQSTWCKLKSQKFFYHKYKHDRFRFMGNCLYTVKDILNDIDRSKVLVNPESFFKNEDEPLKQMIIAFLAFLSRTTHTTYDLICTNFLKFENCKLHHVIRFLTKFYHK